MLGFAQARPPDQPSLVALDIVSSNSVALRLQDPTGGDSAITTKFKGVYISLNYSTLQALIFAVQWSTRADFSPITGEREIFDTSKPNCTIELTHGRRYYFRAACGNLKGYGMYVSSAPESVIPSSWRDLEQKESR